ncbi:MAG: hypothetical protein A2Y93_15405 [Chloroflexi bacterium RBG_13_68_17]|nr:MAG: hypothetical protein A2Y93_15405 [Chloroflexi bacterium RBG_13_68_17]
MPDHFDLLAPIYDRLVPPPADDHLAELAGLPVAGRLLDAGGGTGRIARRLAGLAGAVTIADASRRMLTAARRLARLGAVACQAERLPFAAGTFERVVMVDAYHHVADQDLTLRELWRVLERGGRMVIEEPDIDTWAVRLIAWGERLLLMRSRFERAEAIASRLSALGAEVSLRRDRNTAWVVAARR